MNLEEFKNRYTQLVTTLIKISIQKASEQLKGFTLYSDNMYKILDKLNSEKKRLLDKKASDAKIKYY